MRVRADDTRESDEHLTIELRDAVNGRITRAVATLIIRNDD